MIPESIIDEIKSRIDIVDVVTDFVTLKKSGASYVAKSPFKDEKTASFYVVPSKGIFKDFSSGKGGDAITFIMEHEGVSYMEALNYLAKKYGVLIPKAIPLPGNEIDSLLIATSFACDYFRENLISHKEGISIGSPYFQERGISLAMIKKFELGYAINQWDELEKTAISNGYSLPVLIDAGLVIQKEDGKHYDRFRGRVIFPIHNLGGRVVAFGARLLGKQKDQPKYINSPQSKVYNKSAVLYGLHLAKNPIRKLDFTYLVEGYTDVIALHQCGIENVVASAGTALTQDQVKLLKRFTNNLTVLFDGDSAGIDAALRGINLALKEGLNVRVVPLPAGTDPDSFARGKSSSEVEQYLSSSSVDFITYKARHFNAMPLTEPSGRVEAIRSIIESIALIGDPIKRSVYIQETASLMKISERLLNAELTKISQANNQRESSAPSSHASNFKVKVFADSPISSQAMIELQEREAIRLLLNYPDVEVDGQSLSTYIIQELQELEFLNPLYRDIFDQIKEQLALGKVIDADYFLTNGSQEIRSLVTDLITPRYNPSHQWQERLNVSFEREESSIEQTAYSNVLRYKFRAIQRLMETNLQHIKSSDDDQLNHYLTIHEQLKSSESEIASILGIAIAK